MEPIFISFWCLTLTTLKEICDFLSKLAFRFMNLKANLLKKSQISFTVDNIKHQNNTKMGSICYAVLCGKKTKNQGFHTQVFCHLGSFLAVWSTFCTFKIKILTCGFGLRRFLTKNQGFHTQVRSNDGRVKCSTLMKTGATILK